ncbi:MAG: amino acid permease [Chitinophagales bacterium]|nr:amino acid permease [Chitinophagales bacterium]
MSTELKRSLGLYGLTMVAIGSTIGSGIFRTPGAVADHVQHPTFMLLLWILGGVVALTGALSFAEMGSMFPGAGGLYVYLRKAYGDAVAFSFGWYILFVSTSGSIAALSMVSAEHILYLMGYAPKTGPIVPLAIGITFFLTLVNLFGVKIGEWIANIFTGAKLLGLLLIIGAGLFWADPAVMQANFEIPRSGLDFPEGMGAAFAAGFVSVLWSYGGWQHASFMAAETRNPQRNVPRAMMWGALTVTLVYVLANLAYLRLLPVGVMGQSDIVATEAMEQVFPWAGVLIAVLIAVSTFGTTGIYCMTAPRIYYAMAQDGIFFPWLAKVHPRWRTPVNAMLLQSGWSVVLLLFWGNFKNLIEYVTFIDWIGLMMTGAAVIVLRRKMPDAERQYRTSGYPLTPIIFVAICLWFVLFTLMGQSRSALAGIAVVASGLLVYYTVFKGRNAEGRRSSK